MKTTEAAQVLEALARGIDPETGEIFPQDSLFNNPDVVRALFLGANALNQQSPQRAKRGVRPERECSKASEIEGTSKAGKPWTQNEEDRLSAAFKQGKTVEELAADHGRNVGGIQSRLAKLGLVENWSAAPEKAALQPARSDQSESSVP